ncbi:MAG: transferrin-binding protein-like solute binding protein [Hyphomicrobiaceae bacterium]
MTNKLTLLLALPVVAGLVTACGGGGGRSAAPKATRLGAPAPKPKNVATPVPTPKTDLTPVPTPKNVANPALKNPNGKAHFVFVPRAGLIFPEVTTANGRTLSPALVEVSQTASSKTIRYQGPSRLINADSIPIDEEKSEPGASIYGEKDKLLLGAITSAGSTSLEYSEIGLIGDHRQAVSNVGAYHAGQLTRADQLPTGVTATYTGVFSGAGGAVGDVSGGLSGKANITANFGSGDVKGQVSDLRGGLLGFIRQDYGLSIQGKITGNAYAGTAGFTDKNGKRSQSETVTSSAMSGGFYGPNGVETAGALRIEGTPGEDISKKPHVIVGAFGAKRDFPQTSAKPRK